MRRAATIGVLAAAVAAVPDSASADPQRAGAQVEAFVGGSVCLDGRASCSRTAHPLTGRMQPSFGGGVNLGFRPRPWIVVGAMYRVGMFDPDYADGLDVIDAVHQHTVGVGVRPILVLGRFDLGLQVGVAYSRQIADVRERGRGEFTQGVSLVTGVTADVFVTDHVFLGLGVDALVNLHGTVCRRTELLTTCARAVGRVPLIPNHQLLFGARVGTTFG
jgi:hypothetical protein